MNLPGSPRLHVWVGLLVALVGVLVGGYAYTSWRIYHLHYLPVALVGLALVIGGSALAGYGQANRPRLGGRDAGDDPGLIKRLTTAIVGLRGGADDEREDEEDSSEEGTDGDGDETGQAPDGTDGEPEADDAGDPEADEEPASQEPSDEGRTSAEDEASRSEA